jgi:hypothetical protein
VNIEPCECNQLLASGSCDAGPVVDATPDVAPPPPPSVCMVTAAGSVYECLFEIGSPTAGAVTPFVGGSSCTAEIGAVTPSCATGMVGCCTTPDAVGVGPPRWSEQCYYDAFVASEAAGSNISFAEQVAMYQTACGGGNGIWTTTPWFPGVQSSSDAGRDGAARDAASEAQPTCGP